MAALTTSRHSNKWALTVAADIEVILTGGVQPKNIFSVVAGDVTVGTGFGIAGVILAGSKVLFESGSTLEGRIWQRRASSCRWR
jgi:hypothetical protein